MSRNVEPNPQSPFGPYDTIARSEVGDRRSIARSRRSTQTPLPSLEATLRDDAAPSPAFRHESPNLGTVTQAATPSRSSTKQIWREASGLASTMAQERRRRPWGPGLRQAHPDSRFRGPLASNSSWSSLRFGSLLMRNRTTSSSGRSVATFPASRAADMAQLEILKARLVGYAPAGLPGSVSGSKARFAGRYESVRFVCGRQAAGQCDCGGGFGAPEGDGEQVDQCAPQRAGRRRGTCRVVPANPFRRDTPPRGLPGWCRGNRMRAMPVGETSSPAGTEVQQIFRTASLPMAGDHSRRASTSYGRASVIVTVTEAGDRSRLVRRAGRR